MIWADWIPNLLLAWGVQSVGVLSPGPGVALILGVALSEGRRASVITCLGISMAAVVLATLAVLGLAAVLAGMETAMTAVRWIGAAYLGWLAIGAFRKAAAPPAPPKAREVSVKGSAALMVKGFTMQMANPKAIFYWIAVGAVAGLEAAPLPVIGLFLIGGWAISFFGHGAWAILLSSAPFRALYASARRWVEAALGGFFAFAAFKLATMED